MVGSRKPSYEAGAARGHAAQRRHNYISTLQAAGIEVATVAKLAGHANPAVTLGIYTQAVKKIDAAADALEKAYAPPSASM